MIFVGIFSLLGAIYFVIKWELAREKEEKEK